MDLADLKQANYSKLIDEEIWAFITKTQQYYPDDTAKRSIDEQRAIYTDMCQAFSVDYPENVTSEDSVILGRDYDVPVRRYKTLDSSSKTIIVFMHGGGFVVGGLESHDSVCAELCAKTGYKVTSIDYRLSPEHKHPAAFDDCLTCVEHEAGQKHASVLLCGDSAGGNLAAAVAHRIGVNGLSAHGASGGSASAGGTSGQGTGVEGECTETIKLAGQVLIYPELGGDTSLGSYIQHANAPMLTAGEVAFYLQVRIDGERPNADPSFAPLQATDFSRLPETLVVSAQCDPLSDDGRSYCNAIVKAGGQATWINEPGLVHGFLRARHSSARAKQSFNTIVEALKQLGSKG